MQLTQDNAQVVEGNRQITSIDGHIRKLGPQLLSQANGPAKSRLCLHKVVHPEEMNAQVEVAPGQELSLIRSSGGWSQSLAQFNRPVVSGLGIFPLSDEPGENCHA